MKKSIFTMIVAIGMCSSSFAAQDHNSSRSNKTGSIAADLGNTGTELSKSLSVATADDYASGELLNVAGQLEASAKDIRDRMLIGTFINRLDLLLVERKCNELSKDKITDCINQAVISAETFTLKR